MQSATGRTSCFPFSIESDGFNNVAVELGGITVEMMTG
jgi:hypothetical protein